jgi:hypothetical protein
MSDNPLMTGLEQEPCQHDLIRLKKVITN